MPTTVTTLVILLAASSHVFASTHVDPRRSRAHHRRDVSRRSDSDAGVAQAQSIVMLSPEMLAQQPVIAAATPSSAAADDDDVATLDAGSPSRPLVIAYYPDWAGATFPPEKIDFNRFDWLDFAFAIPTSDFKLGWDDAKSSPDLLRRLVKGAHAKGKKVKLSVGGATGSKYISDAVSNDENQAAFAQNIADTYREYDLDGIDMDWEFPGQGSGSSHADTDNLLAFFQRLRSVLPPSARITAATQTSPFVDANGDPLKDASEFAKVLDWVLIMNYDVWGASSKPGANAPLNNGCQTAEQPTENAVSAYEQWTAAGFPASKLVLGVPSYGYVSTSQATSLRARSHARDFDDEDDATAVAAQSDSVVVSAGPDNDGGQIQFRDLVAQGALVRSSSGYTGGGGFARQWDGCSSTPWLRSENAGQVVTYDDPESLAMKSAFVKQVGMLGVNMFDVHGDTDDWALTDALWRGYGIEFE